MVKVLGNILYSCKSRFYGITSGDLGCLNYMDVLA